MKQILTILLLTVATLATAQNPIPNPGFENWSNFGGCWFETPDNWMTNNSQVSCGGVVKDTNAWKGNYAARVIAYGCSGMAWTGFLINTHPMNLYCYAKAALKGSNSVSIKVVLFNNGTAVDSGLWTNSSNISSFSLITIPITQNSTVTDSAVIYLTSGNSIGELAVDDLYFDFTSGINEKQDEVICTLYPNPVGDVLTINTTNALVGSTYIITDQAGREILTGKLTQSSTSVDVSQLAKGIYLLQVGGENKKCLK